MKRKNKSVSFDLTDAYEKQLLEHAEKAENGKYSKYIKRLIANDMKGFKEQPIHATIVVDTENDDKDAMSGFL